MRVRPPPHAHTPGAKPSRKQHRGHTDSVGTDPYNRDLSARPAAAVREALVSTYRIAPGRITTTGFGKSRPREPNATPEGRARNRSARENYFVTEAMQ